MGAVTGVTQYSLGEGEAQRLRTVWVIQNGGIQRNNQLWRQKRESEAGGTPNKPKQQANNKVRVHWNKDFSPS